MIFLFWPGCIWSYWRWAKSLEYQLWFWSYLESSTIVDFSKTKFSLLYIISSFLESFVYCAHKLIIMMMMMIQTIHPINWWWWLGSFKIFYMVIFSVPFQLKQNLSLSWKFLPKCTHYRQRIILATIIYNHIYYIHNTYIIVFF